MKPKKYEKASRQCRLSLLCLTVLLSMLCAAGCTHRAEKPTYETAIFDTTYLHTVEITIDEGDWQALQGNALAKEDHHGDVVIDGETFTDVCISTKGSYSLRGIAGDESATRYSLKLSFGKFQSGQTYHGLDILNLNNNFSDASQMKDYITYEMYRKLGAVSPLTSFTKVTVNGEPYGMFLAVEEIRDGFLRRNFDGEGELYKPESMQLTEINEANGQAAKKAADEGIPADQVQQINTLEALNPYTGGADLRYTDDLIASYPDIFENCKTAADEKAMQRVIRALKNLSEGNVEKAVDISAVITYFAIHNFTANPDSYIGILGHNYFLYENDGRLSMLPWDYNYYDVLCTEARAATVDALAEHHVDADIDAPLTVPEDSRPMWTWIVSDDEYLAQYHTELRRLLADCVDSGWAAKEIARMDTLIRAEVEADPNAVYTIDEYDAAVADLKAFFVQRADFIHGQLG